MPARVLLQDFTGVPCVVDLAAMRDGIVALGGDPQKVNPLQPVELVIDHSVQVDHFGTANALGAQRRSRISPQSRALRVPPLGADRVPQLPRRAARDRHRAPGQHRIPRARGVPRRRADGGAIAYPDTVFGTDSHTTMVNGLGVVGWGVGGIEAEAAMLGQPSSMLIPPVLGYRLTGKLPEGATATDLVLTITEALRKKGVVGKFVEFFGPGLATPDDCRSRDARQHVPRVRRHRRDLPDRRHDARVPAPDRPRGQADRAGRGLREGAGLVPDGRYPGCGLQRNDGARSGVGRAEPRRPAPPAGSRAAVEGQAVVCRRARRIEEGREGPARARRWQPPSRPRRSSNTARS